MNTTLIFILLYPDGMMYHAGVSSTADAEGYYTYTR